MLVTDPKLTVIVVSYNTPVLMPKTVETPRMRQRQSWLAGF